MFADIVSNGKKFVNLDKVAAYDRSLPIKKLFDKHKPIYFDDFFDLDEQKYGLERPSAIFNTAIDDRKVIPRLGFNNLD